ncbi:MAG: hypothetical protein HY901_37270, partial [Deltaproteobacteria bacterium]|nr:hypothetical protein [Deltaproteobacteria bacterium]
MRWLDSSILLVSALLLCVCAGCSAKLEVASGAQIACQSSTDCPEGWECPPAMGRCIRSGVAGLPPTLDARRVEPAAARRGQEVWADFTPSAELGLPPLVVLDSPERPSFVPAERRDGFAYSFKANASNLPEGDWRVLATLIDHHGVVATDVEVGKLRVDFTPPALAGAIGIATPTVPKDGIARFRLVVTEPLARPPSVQLAWGNESRPVSDVTAVDALSFDVAYPAQNDEPATPAAISVSMIDVAGNTGASADAAHITFDHQGPRPIACLASLRLIPTAGNLLTDVLRATTGTTVQLFLAFDEPVVSRGDAQYPIVRTSTVPPYELTRTIEAGMTFVFEWEVPTTAADGDYSIEVVTRDAVGNTESLSLADLSCDDPGFERLRLSVDRTAPAAPAVDTPGRLVLERKPWGTESTQGRSESRLVGQSGAVEACGAGERICTWLMAYADGEGASEIGRTQVQADGSVDFKFSAVDYPHVFVAAVDAAGNRSPIVETRDGTWTATLIGKTPGNLTSNPHIVWQRPFDRAGAGSQTQLRLELRDYQALQRMDEQVASLDTAFGWRQQNGSANLPDARREAATAYDSTRGRLVMFGGYRQSGTREILYDDTWQLGENGWTQWSNGGGRPQARRGHAMVFDSRRAVSVLFGGVDDAGMLLDDIWEFGGNNWERRCDGIPVGDVCAPPSTRADHAMAYDPDLGRVVVFGGRSDGPLNDETWAWDGSAWVTIDSAVRPSARSGAGMDYHAGKHQMVLFGGLGSTAMGDTWVLDEAGWHLVQPSGAPKALQDPTVVYDPLHEVVVAIDGHEHWEWNGQSWRVLATCDQSSCAGLPFHGAAAGAYDTIRRAVVLFGGERLGTSSFNTNDTRAYDGRGWSPIGLGGAGPSNGLMIYDESAGNVLLFAPGSTNQTWTWSGEGWSQANPASAPGFATDRAPSLAYDASRQRGVLYGGASGAETWEWGAFGASTCGTLPRCWRQSLATSAPGTRHGSMMSYDRRRKRIVLFGGRNPSLTGVASLYGDTWEYGDWGALCAANPCWRQVATTGPAARFRGAMAYDELRGVTVLYGGTQNPGTTNPNGTCDGGSRSDCGGTWEWSGRSWSKRASSSPESGERRDHAMVFDSQLGRVLAYGGQRFEGAHVADTTYPEVIAWDGTAWRLVPGGSATRPQSSSSIVGFAGLAYDRSRHETVSTEQGETWLWSSDGWQAAALVAVDWSRTELSVADVTGAEVLLGAGSTGSNAELDASTLGGIDLAMWDADAGRFSPIALTTAHGVTSITTTLPGAQVRHALGS